MVAGSYNEMNIETLNAMLVFFKDTLSIDIVLSVCALYINYI